MMYVIWVDSRMLSAPVGKEGECWLRHHILPALATLSHEEYAEGPAGFLCTAARSSYVLSEAGVVWLIEWRPGLVAILFRADGSMFVASKEVRQPDETPDSLPP